MNAFSAIAIIYSMLAIASGSLLYLSLKGKIDASAKYFLTAESFTAIGAGAIALINLHPEYQIPVLFVIINFLFLASEISILFSLKNLTKININNTYLLAISGALVLVLVAEFIRSSYAIVGVSIVMNSLQVSICLLVLRTLMLNSRPLLKEYRFLGWLKGFEIGIFVFWCVMLLKALTLNPEIPRGNSNFAIVIYSLFITLSIFRFISYIGFRITWLGLNQEEINPLNQNLAYAVTAKNTLANKLMASNRIISISALASTLAHELSQPLTAITLQADSLNREINKNDISHEELKKSLIEIQDQSIKINLLISNLRKLISSRQAEFQSFDISRMCEEVFEIIEPDLISKKINFKKNILTNAEMYGDKIQLQQVLINLINNSVDAIERRNHKNGEITISIKDNPNSVQIQIDDNGAGIDSQILPNIFELHQTNKPDGLGIGLWLCQNIINIHHGLIVATNIASGGAQFTIDIPFNEKPISN